MLKYLKYGIEKKKRRYQSRMSDKSAATQLKYLPDP